MSLDGNVTHGTGGLKLYKQVYNIERKQGFEAVFMDKGKANEKLDNITMLLPKT